MNELQNLLTNARQEIIQLRRSNEVLQAKVSTMELCAGFLNARLPEHSQRMSIDVAWELQKEIDKQAAASIHDLASLTGVRAVMGRDVPMLLDKQTADVQWIKRFREKTGCSLLEGKTAMQLMLDAEDDE